MKTLIEKILLLLTSKDRVYRKRRFTLLIALATAITFGASAMLEDDHGAEVAQLKAFILTKNPSVEKAELNRLAQTIVMHAQRLQIEDDWQIDNEPVDRIALLTGIIYTESSFTKKALSKSGAIGYMQLMKPTGQWLARTHNLPLDNKNIWEAKVNIAIGVTYVNMLLKEFHDIPRAMLAYNAGPGAVKRGGGIPAYWQKIHRTYREKLIHDKEFNQQKPNLVAAR